MKKAIKWLTFGLAAALTCVSFVGCKEEEQAASTDTLEGAAAKMYAAGYTEMQIDYDKEDYGDGYYYGILEAYHPIMPDDMDALLFKTEAQAEAYWQEEGGAEYDGEDVFKQYGKWVLRGDTAAVDAFCSSSGKSTSHEVLTAFGKACKLDIVTYVETMLGDGEASFLPETNINVVLVGYVWVSSENAEVFANLCATEEEAQALYEAYVAELGEDNELVKRKGKWVISSDEYDSEYDSEYYSEYLALANALENIL